MPINQTSKSRFRSSYAGGFVAPHQWLAEFMCERKAAKEGRALAPHFWEDKEWGKFFKFQAVIASRLLRQFYPLAIAEAIRSKKGVYSLNAKFMFPVYQQMQLKYEGKVLEYEQNEVDYHPIVEALPVSVEKPRAGFGSETKSLKDKLDG